MDAVQLIANFIQENGIAVAILVFIGWFLTVKLWPWLTKEYWPILVKREDQRTSTMKLLSDTLVKLESGYERIMLLVDRNYTASRERDELVLESVAALHARMKNIPLATGADVARAEREMRELRDMTREGKD